ncbi:MAG: DUF58 domain-containing protein, partial [Planctomycetota bacterium]
ERLGRRGLVVLVSDLIAPLEDLQSALRRLRYDGHSVIVAHVVDPAEREFPFDGGVQFEGLESGEFLRTDGRQLRAAYLESFRQFQQAVADSCLEQQIDYMMASTDEPLDRALGRFLASHARGY